MRSFPSAVLVTLIVITPALAHISGTIDYESWTKPGTSVSCCNNADCGPIADWGGNEKDGFWIMFQGKKYPVSAKAVLPIPSPDLQAHACWMGRACQESLSIDGKSTTIYRPDCHAPTEKNPVHCFTRPLIGGKSLPPSVTSSVSALSR